VLPPEQAGQSTFPVKRQSGHMRSYFSLAHRSVPFPRHELQLVDARPLQREQILPVDSRVPLPLQSEHGILPGVADRPSSVAPQTAQGFLPVPLQRSQMP